MRTLHTFWSQIHAPELELMNLQTEYVGNLEELSRQLGEDGALVANAIKPAAKSDIGRIYKLFRPIEQSPLTFLKCDDNTLTGNVKEMDAILRSKWRKCAKHENEARPVPDADEFFERYGHKIPHFPQEIQKLTADDI